MVRVRNMGAIRERDVMGTGRAAGFSGDKMGATMFKGGEERGDSEARGGQRKD